MNFLKLSIMNLRQNLKNYSMYIFSMIFSVIVFYNFTTLMFSEQFKRLQGLSIVSAVAGLCIFVLVMFFIFFISYSSSFFIEQRKKELGIYTFMGVENSKIALLFAQEGLITGLISLASGILGGIVFNKLFLMIIVKISRLDTVVKFEISPASIIITSLMFIAILIFVFIKEYLSLVKMDIAKLLNASKSYQNQDSKNKTLQGFLGLAIIILAYVLIVYYRDLNIPFTIAIIGTVLMVIGGTEYLFKGFFSFYILKLINNKKFLYKNTNVISYNNIIFRIKDNNKTLAQVTILITCCLTSVIVGLSFTGIFDTNIPYSLYYFSQNENDDKIVDKAISLSNEEVDFKVSTKLIPYKSSVGDYIDDVNIVKYSEIENIINHRDVKNSRKIEKNKPNEGQAILIIPSNLINAFNFKTTISIESKDVKITDAFSAPLFEAESDYSILIVNDKDYNYVEENLKEIEPIHFKGITLKDFEDTKEISTHIKNDTDTKITSADMFDQGKYDSMKALYFLGLFVALVFMISVGSIMYFKCISDASKDKVKFDTLRKLGTSQDYINKVIFKQVGIFFMFPLIVGVIHSIFAGYSVASFFNQSGYFSTIPSIIVFTIIYIAYYIFTAKKYINETK